MNIEILSAKYDNPEHSSYTVRVKDIDSGAVFPFGVIVGREDEGDVYVALMERMSEVEIEECTPPTDEALAAVARAKRDALLAACDYFVMPDYEAETEALARVKAYRKALRDLPTQEGFPRAIAWPDKPEALK